jgi:hypothetical protein
MLPCLSNETDKLDLLFTQKKKSVVAMFLIVRAPPNLYTHTGKVYRYIDFAIGD